MRPLKDDEIIELGDLIDNGFAGGWGPAIGVGYTPADFGNKGIDYRRPIKVTDVKEKTDSTGNPMTYDHGTVTFWNKIRCEIAHIRPGIRGLALTVEPQYFVAPCVVAEGLAFREECEREALCRFTCAVEFSFEAVDTDTVEILCSTVGCGTSSRGTSQYIHRDTNFSALMPEPVIAAARKFMGWT